MKKHPSNLDRWDRERKRERQTGRIVACVLMFFAIMAFSQDAAACDILGCFFVCVAGFCLGGSL